MCLSSENQLLVIGKHCLLSVICFIKSNHSRSPFVVAWRVLFKLCFSELCSPTILSQWKREKQVEVSFSWDNMNFGSLLLYTGVLEKIMFSTGRRVLLLHKSFENPDRPLRPIVRGALLLLIEFSKVSLIRFSRSRSAQWVPLFVLFCRMTYCLWRSWACSIISVSRGPSRSWGSITLNQTVCGGDPLTR